MKKKLVTLNRKKVKMEPFYKASPKQALVLYRALSRAYDETRDYLYGAEKKALARLRDMAAVAVGKPTLFELYEEDEED